MFSTPWESQGARAGDTDVSKALIDYSQAHPSATEDDVAALFSNYGPVVKSNRFLGYSPSHGAYSYGQVEMANGDDAAAAVQQLGGTAVWPGMQSPMTAQLRAPKTCGNASVSQPPPPPDPIFLHTSSTSTQPSSSNSTALSTTPGPSARGPAAFPGPSAQQPSFFSHGHPYAAAEHAHHVGRAYGTFHGHAVGPASQYMPPPSLAAAGPYSARQRFEQHHGAGAPAPPMPLLDGIPATPEQVVQAVTEYMSRASRPKPPPGCAPQAMKLFVGNIPKHCGDAALEAVFEQYGVIVEVAVTRNRHSTESKGSAFVWYQTFIEGARAILSLHGRHAFPDAKGEHVRLVTVRPATSNKRHSTPHKRAGPRGAPHWAPPLPLLDGLLWPAAAAGAGRHGAYSDVHGGAVYGGGPSYSRRNTYTIPNPAYNALSHQAYGGADYAANADLSHAHCCYAQQQQQQEQEAYAHGAPSGALSMLLQSAPQPSSDWAGRGRDPTHALLDGLGRLQVGDAGREQEPAGAGDLAAANLAGYSYGQFYGGAPLAGSGRDACMREACACGEEVDVAACAAGGGGRRMLLSDSSMAPYRSHEHGMAGQLPQARLPQGGQERAGVQGGPQHAGHGQEQGEQEGGRSQSRLSHGSDIAALCESLASAGGQEPQGVTSPWL